MSNCLTFETQGFQSIQFISSIFISESQTGYQSFAVNESLFKVSKKGKRAAF